jgi:hypothetical protein
MWAERPVRVHQGVWTRSHGALSENPLCGRPDPAR